MVSFHRVCSISGTVADGESGDRDPEKSNRSKCPPSPTFQFAPGMGAKISEEPGVPLGTRSGLEKLKPAKRENVTHLTFSQVGVRIRLSSVSSFSVKVAQI
jgi:hypothetical protein